MRVWHPSFWSRLKSQNFIGMHREIHSMATAIRNKKGYHNHPETKRWNRFSIVKVHRMWVREAHRRGMPSGLKHQSVIGSLFERFISYFIPWPKEITPVNEQWLMLDNRNAWKEVKDND